MQVISSIGIVMAIIIGMIIIVTVVGKHLKDLVDKYRAEKERRRVILYQNHPTSINALRFDTMSEPVLRQVLEKLKEIEAKDAVKQATEELNRRTEKIQHDGNL